MGQTIVIGIDCATEDGRTGVARGTSDGTRCRVDLAKLASDLWSLPAKVAECSRGADRVLVAIDSPLGWPAALGAALATHAAGRPIPGRADDLFTRRCDQHVRRVLGKKPLEVGADRIARTARQALELLDEIGTAIGHRVELAWEPAFEARVAAIEVYPAATLIALGGPSGGYKRGGDFAAREQILQRLSEEMGIAAEAEERGRKDPDVLDAMVCVLGGHDFLRGACTGPEDRSIAEKEGWIWFRDRELRESRG